MMNTPSSFGSSNPNNRRAGVNAKNRQLLPLTVWLCPDTAYEAGTTTAGQDHQRAELCLRHTRAVGTELARQLISTCTPQDAVVAEAFTSSDATLRAAAELDRRAIACVPHLPLARYIGGRLRADCSPQQLSRIAMRPCRPDQMHRGLADYAGEVALVIAAPPPYSLGSPTSAGRCPGCLSDALTGSELRIDGFLLAAWRILRRGGHLALITTSRHEKGRLVDPAPQIIRQARTLGFRYSQHVIALRVPVQGDELLVQASPTQVAQLRDTKSRALPPAVSVHADVCLFTKPPATRAGGKGADR
ncbi:hypothetical protein Arub01_57230 [Actinomadura rubrobrunea]|uniref:Uncharacterized protein n=1 Tax=Actinomadura rubrobrunea TaxID=115335 RepID=A0A9W6PZZ9_9ACTN|nr:hypothetical protein Arub01_57230 [Actinomadura rubrobrunea]